MRSLAVLYDLRYKTPFEQIAVGVPARKLSSPASATSRCAPTCRRNEAIYLRQVAIEALALLGDQDTLANLRQSRGRWPPGLERTFYWTSEEISWRLSQTAR